MARTRGQQNYTKGAVKPRQSNKLCPTCWNVLDELSINKDGRSVRVLVCPRHGVIDK
jgi:uncharacterized radical SAM superfamily Fe-S cluster-containing enzyme